MTHSFDFSIAFGVAQNGWLSLHVKAGSVELEFSGSDVPNNPVQELIDALANAAAGVDGAVWWHLEPDGYYFQFSPMQDNVRLQVFYESFQQQTKQKTEVASVISSKQQVLLPIWRALRKLETTQLAEPHWPPVDFSRITAIKESLHG
jgi:hypothetical protein